MNIEISTGEALDRLSILEIKQQKIHDSGKLHFIQQEIHSLHGILEYKQTYLYYYTLLLDVNVLIWNHTDTLHAMGDTPIEYGKLARVVFNLNKSRFRIKNILNRLSTSNIQEQKNTTLSAIHIELKEEKDIDIKYLTSLSIEYDVITITCTTHMKQLFETRITQFNYIFNVVE